MQPPLLLTVVARLVAFAALSAVSVVAARAATLLVANKSDATVTLLDLATRAPIATLPTGAGPHEIAVAPDGKSTLVTNYGGATNGSTLTVIDLVGRRVVRTIELAPYQRPHGAEYLADGRRTLVTAESNRALLVVDVERGVVERTIPTDAEVSHMVVADAAGRCAYVANIRSGSVSVLDLERGTLVRTIATGRGSEGIALTPDGAELWVTNRDDDTVAIVDTASLAVVATLAAAKFPIRAKATPDGKRILVSCAASGDVAVFDRARRTLERRVVLPVARGTTDGKLFGGAFGDSSVPIGIVVAADGARAWVAHATGDVVSEIDLATLAKVGELRAGKEPDGLGWSGISIVH